MFQLFKRDPKKKLRLAYQLKLKEAMEAQRSGDIQGYARLTAEAESIMDRIKSI